MREELFKLQDVEYRDFQKKLIPTVDPDTVIGVRTPELRKLAKQMRGTPEADAFLEVLPHAFFDENQLHAFLISEEKIMTDASVAWKCFCLTSITGRPVIRCRRRCSRNTKTIF